jgi:glyoxylase-like metal-dependent hydrolase (beta-lactamase superfamily II)/ferredoxin
VARLADRLPENASGDFFVDTSCIDCDTCRFVAPGVFGRSERAAQSFVRRQPEGPAERRRAAMALIACPTSSIGTAGKGDVAAAARAFPEPITPSIHYCGYASEASFGASSYLIIRPGGNVLVDSPRAARPLFERIAALGGVRWMFLTHRDDVADHALFHKEFGCERILHASDVGSRTRDVERKLEGSEPVALAEDLLAIPVPGHTRGSAALLHAGTHLFTGDHLAYDDEDDRLEAWRSVCWYSWEEQTRSMERLLAHRFTWVLPGHGRRWQAPSAGVMRARLEDLVRRMRA